MYIHFYNALIALWNSFIYKAWMHLILVFRKIAFPRKYLVIILSFDLKTMEHKILNESMFKVIL